MDLSVVIPALNAADTLPRLLAALDEAGTAGLAFEAVVADGGSRDGTRALAAAAGARVLEVPRGRGRQLREGAAAAAGRWLLFLHADSVPSPGWASEVRRFIDDPESRERAAAFRFALDDPARAARRIEAVVAWRCRALALPYGDQGLLISRAFYDRLGGFRPIELMEDVDMVRRIGRRRLAFLDTAVVTSAERYRRDGWTRRPLRNLACLSLYFLGLPTRLIARLYG